MYIIQLSLEAKKKMIGKKLMIYSYFNTSSEKHK